MGESEFSKEFIFFCILTLVSVFERSEYESLLLLFVLIACTITPYKISIKIVDMNEAKKVIYFYCYRLNLYIYIIIHNVLSISEKNSLLENKSLNIIPK